MLSTNLIIVLALVAAAVALFVWERFKPAVVAIAVMGVLLATGIITPEQGLSGFSNQATVAVAAMFVLSAGLEESGAVDKVGIYLSEGLTKRYLLSFVALLAGAGIMSAFINNTAVVAILIPIILKIASDAGISPSKLLIPVSFASMFGGVCTLIGTSTNLLASSIIEDSGLDPIGMFELAPVGVVLFAVGMVYLYVTRNLVPERRDPGELTEDIDVEKFLTDLELHRDSALEGSSIADALHDDIKELDVVAVIRGDEVFEYPDDDFELELDDILRVRGKIETLEKIRRADELIPRLSHAHEMGLDGEVVQLVEVAVSPEGELAGHKLAETNFEKRFGATPLGMRQRGEMTHRDLDEVRLKGGDVLLVAVSSGQIESLREAREVMLLSTRDIEPDRSEKTIPAVVAIIVGVVALAALDIMPIVASATLGGLLLVITGIISFERAIRAIDWDVVFLLAGVLSLGVALEETGGDQLLSAAIVWFNQLGGNYAALGFIYVSTALLTSTMSNNATAALLIPIALASAPQMGIDPRPLVMAVTFAASSSFLTPVGYQTNTMVYGAGHYQFADFVKLGGPLTLLFAVVATFLIPLVWPF